MTTTNEKIPSTPPAVPLGPLAARAAGMLAVLTLLTGVAYPLLVTAVATVAFPEKARGSLVSSGAGVRGSVLIGQSFEDPKHFWGRLSATAPAPYNAGSSTASNAGVMNDAITKNAKARIEALKAADPESTGPIPVDLVTTSASGLDPHISPAAADYQVRRVARARGVDESKVRALVTAYTEDRTLGFLGDPRVNVLLLNLALDESK